MSKWIKRSDSVPRVPPGTELHRLLQEFEAEVDDGLSALKCFIGDGAAERRDMADFKDELEDLNTRP